LLNLKNFEYDDIGADPDNPFLRSSDRIDPAFRELHV
jgi:hypothetical protein